MKDSDFSRLPLRGIKVLEISTMLTASFATMMLADQGAEVIKIEPGGIGDPLRKLGPENNGMSSFFYNFNRGKKSLCLDLKTPQAQEIVLNLARTADVLIHNFRPGVMDRLGLGSDVLRQANSALIYVAISGFGKSGPLADAPAYDVVVQAMSGFTAVQTEQGVPGFVKSSVCDKVTACTAWQAITAALFARERSAEHLGQHIDISMLHAALAFLWPDGMPNETFLDEDVEKMPPLSDAFWATKVRDGFITLFAVNDAQWAGVFRAIKRPELIENIEYQTVSSRFQNIGKLKDEVASGFRDFTLEEALAVLAAEDDPVTACLSRDEVIEHPQVRANNVIQKHNDSVMGLVNVVTPATLFEGRAAALTAPSPFLGADTQAILEDLGYDQTAIRTMEANGVIVRTVVGGQS
jgi:crotonobetainyl-CoA:carnitine CoA-transferase CaiB-like acyl-CoA transferase